MRIPGCATEPSGFSKADERPGDARSGTLCLGRSDGDARLGTLGRGRSAGDARPGKVQHLHLYPASLVSRPCIKCILATANPVSFVG
jgi:hypothetical protein